MRSPIRSVPRPHARPHRAAVASAVGATIRDQLHRAGLKSTASRIAVLTELRRTPSPLSHGELVDALSSHGFDRATLYRNLIDLTEAGLLRRIDVGDHTWRFEARAPAEPARDAAGPGPVAHPHFVCVDCGVLTCLPDVDVSISPRAGSPRPRIADVSQVLLQGRCDDC